MRQLRIGGGAGFSGDRIEPAVELVEKGEIQYLIFECLAERTIAIAQQAKMRDASSGYDSMLADRIGAVLRLCSEKRVRIVTNMGAANPVAAAAKIGEIAREQNLRSLKVASVTGDDVIDILKAGEFRLQDNGALVSSLGDRLVSGNAYLGASPIVEALRNRADIVVTGRVADPSLVLGPLIHEFGWSMDDWNRLGQGTVVGHLLECAGQVTGGYFSDPGHKDITRLARLGFPIGVVKEDGSVVITKVRGSGGKVTAATCKEQLLYEIHDPARYLTPDVVADFSDVTVTEVGADQVAIVGGKGRPRTDTLKVSVGYIDSYIGEGQISYAGPGAAARGRLALDIVAERLKMTGVNVRELRCDLIGVDAILGTAGSAVGYEPCEVRARVAGRTETMQDAIRVGNEVETLYTNGPAAGGGATRSAKEIVAMMSTLIPRNLVKPTVQYLET